MTLASRLLRTCLPAAFAAVMLTVSAAPAMAGCQSGTANNTTTFALASGNCQGVGTGIQATAVGYLARATGNFSTVLGFNAYAYGQNATALGAYSGGLNAVAGATMVGAFSGVTGAGTYSTAIGAGASTANVPRAGGAYSIAIGGSDDINARGAQANGYRSIAIGQKSVSADFGTSLGFNTSTVFASTAIGTDATASGNSSAAVGRFSEASGIYASALGTDSHATGAQSVALGYQTRAPASYSVALGPRAQSTQPNAIALGSGSVANVGNTVSVGSTTVKRRIVNVANGVANNDAATLGQVKALIAAASSRSTASHRAQPVNELRREVAELRLLVQRQQAQIAALLGQKEVAALAD